MRTATSAVLAALALAYLPVQAANETKGTSGDTLVSPLTPPISFFWATYDDTVKAIPQCAGFQVFVAPNNGSAVKPTFPFSFTAMPENYPPVTTTLPGVGIGDQFAWSAAYPPGTRIGFAMTDAANNSGGYVDGYTLVPGSTNCTLVDQPSSLPVSFSESPMDQPCDEVIVNIKGGTSPYTLSVVAGTSGLYANVTGVTKKRVNLRNIVPAGQEFHLFVTDSDGQSSIVEQAMMSQLNRVDRCFPAMASSGDSYAYEPTSTATYEPVSAGSTYVPHPSSLHQSQPSQRGATDDLANPEEFEYRLPTDGSSPWAGALAPGARPYH